MNVQLGYYTAGGHTKGDKLLNNSNLSIDTHLWTRYAVHDYLRVMAKFAIKGLVVPLIFF